MFRNGLSYSVKVCGQIVSITSSVLGMPYFVGKKGCPRSSRDRRHHVVSPDKQVDPGSCRYRCIEQMSCKTRLTRMETIMIVDVVGRSAIWSKK